MAVFDSRAYSEDSAKLLYSSGPNFVTHLQLNTSDDRSVMIYRDRWVPIDHDVSYMVTKGNLSYTRYIFKSTKLRSDIIRRYRSKVEFD